MVFIPPPTKLPVNPDQKRGRIANGYVTPQSDRTPQVQAILPKKVLPIVFLPGIMGSNLRMSAARQKKLEKDDNIAWRPDREMATYYSRNDTAAQRQLRLDPLQTVVDEYDPETNPTGKADESSYNRNDAVTVQFEYRLSMEIAGNEAPLLRNDPYGTKPRKSPGQKARERGWGEIYFKSYIKLLRTCEVSLNAAFYGKYLSEDWKKVIGINPKEWNAHSQPPLRPIDEGVLRNVVKGCWFPVHAMGYNWLQSNQVSGENVARRITALMQRYEGQGYQCEKVILVTHSMGGLVARAVIHPAMGNLNDKILGIVHGAMPATGAAATYKRMRCGFESDGGEILQHILGHVGENVTAVLGNSPGGLELLPSQAYGNDWLQVKHKGETVLSLPKKGDPYKEIYTNQDSWYRLIQDGWLNPANQSGIGFENTCSLLNKAKYFHDQIADTYHKQSYAHYGAAKDRPAWHRIVWQLDGDSHFSHVDDLEIVDDSGQGLLQLRDRRIERTSGSLKSVFTATLQPPTDAGDQTVPSHSADHQLASGIFKGIFRQSGYEHQESFRNDKALHSTLYSIVRIAENMKWTR